MIQSSNIAIEKLMPVLQDDVNIKHVTHQTLATQVRLKVDGRVCV